MRQRLRAWGRQNFRAFPWRTETDPWLTLVAEILLQRTTAKQVVPVFEAFRNEYPRAEALVLAGPVAAAETTQRLGLHVRGPVLYELARVAHDNDGVPPDSLTSLRSITGIGPYTAAAWLSLHRGKRAVIVDANVARWLGRLTGCPYPRDPRHVRWVNQLADQLTPPRTFRDYNYAVLDFTMTICTVRRPRCGACPLRPDCYYGQSVATIKEEDGS